MNVLVTGGTGLVGSKVCQALLTKGHRITVLTRSPDKARKEFDFDATFLSNSDLVPEVLKSLDAVVHLAGEPLVEGRWTEEKKKRIMKSRGQYTSDLTKRFVDAGAKLKVFVSASAMGIYGDRGDEVLTEDSEPGDGFLADVCKAWEKPVEEIGPKMSERQVLLRISLVLSGDGGFLGEVLPIFKTGLGGALGDGQQWMSWIHIDDLVKFIAEAVEQDKWSGPVNMASPNPARNKELTKKLNKVLGRFTFLPVPEFALKLAFGEKADMLLASTRLEPEALQKGGFSYDHPELQPALKSCLD
jgi:hypothetical protein